MKDLPHHMKKLNRRVVRTERRMKQEEEGYETRIPAPPENSSRPKKQLRKQAKDAMRKEREERIPLKKTVEERNREMKKRVPVFDRDSKKVPKQGARPSKKKMPRI